MPKEFEISKLLKIVANNKYEATVAAFEAINHIDKLTFTKKEMTRKPAIRALIAMSNGSLQYDYISDETRMNLEDELRNRARQQNESAINAVFNTIDSSAPIADELDEDLDEIGETAPVEVFSDLSSDSEDDDDSDEEEDDDDDDDDEDDSESSKKSSDVDDDADDDDDSDDDDDDDDDDDLEKEDDDDD